MEEKRLNLKEKKKKTAKPHAWILKALACGANIEGCNVLGCERGFRSETQLSTTSCYAFSQCDRVRSPPPVLSVFIFFLLFLQKKSRWLIPEEGQTCRYCWCCWYQLQKQKLALATSLNASLSHSMWIKFIYHYYIWSSSSSSGSGSSRALGVYVLSASSIICSDHTSSLRHKTTQQHLNICCVRTSLICSDSQWNHLQSPSLDGAIFSLSLTPCVKIDRQRASCLLTENKWAHFFAHLKNPSRFFFFLKEAAPFTHGPALSCEWMLQ